MVTKKKPSASRAARAPDRVEPLILRVRGRRVVPDRDPARLYGVKTIAFNQAIKRNIDRFPDDFAFRPSAHEVAILKSQSVTSSVQDADLRQPSRSSSQSVISSFRGRRYLPLAFTEHGALMAANILRDEVEAAISRHRSTERTAAVRRH